MVEIPDSLYSVFSATVRGRDGSYIREIPSSEIDHDALTVTETYRVAIFESPTSIASTTQDAPETYRAQRNGDRHPSEPPVDEGEVRDVTIETVGDQGDGIAKVERGYVLIVPDAQPGEHPTRRSLAAHSARQASWRVRDACINGDDLVFQPLEAVALAAKLVVEVWRVKHLGEKLNDRAGRGRW